MATEFDLTLEAGHSTRLSLGAWRHMFREIWDSRELVRRLWYRDFIGQFRQSFLGILWMIVPPFATALIFTTLRHAEIVNIPMDPSAMSYALYALVGSTVWQMFSSVSLQVTESLAGGGALITKVYFPREVLALGAAGKAMVPTLFQLSSLLVVLLASRYIPRWEMILIPFALLPLIAFSLGIGLLLAPLNVMMRDTGQALGFILRFAMFLTPTVYPTPSLPEVEADGGQWITAIIFWLHNLNPVSHFMNAIRDLIQFGSLIDPVSYAMASAIALVTLAVGWRFFDVCEPLVAERLG